MNQKTETQTDHHGRLLVRTSCAVCKRCWLYVEYGYCIYGGPFAGYQEVRDERRT